MHVRGSGIQVGRYRGERQRHIYPEEGPGEESQGYRFTAGVVVEVETNLPEDQAVATLATMAPFDLAAQPIEHSPAPPGG